MTGVGGGGWRWFVTQITAFESIRQYCIMHPSHVGQPAAAARAAFSFQTRPRATIASDIPLAVTAGIH